MEQKVNPEPFEACVRRFAGERHTFEALGQKLEGRLREIAGSMGIGADVTSRVKSIIGFAEKLVRKGYVENPDQVTDLTGVRIVVKSLHDVERMAAALRAACESSDALFVLDRENVSDKRGPGFGDVEKFGYQSLHLVVEMTGLGGTDWKPFERRKAEVQIRTRAQGVYAEVSHGLTYKGEDQVPRDVRRSLARIAALLESVDHEISGIEARASEHYFRSSLAPEEDLEDRIHWLAILHGLDPSDDEVVGELAVARRRQRRWKDVIDLLVAHQARQELEPHLLRELGLALTQHHKDAPDGSAYRQGQDCLRRAIEGNPEDEEALSCLGGALKRQYARSRDAGQPDTAEEARREASFCYREAFRISGAHNYPLINHVALELMREPLDSRVLEHLGHELSRALARAEAQIGDGLNLPWAMLDASLLHLFLERQEPGIQQLAAAIALSGTRPGWRGALLSHLETLRPIRSCGLGIPTAIALLEMALDSPFSGLETDADISRELASANRIVVVAGGCGRLERSPEELDRFLDNIPDFDGLLISGGTDSGVSGGAGRIAARTGNKARAIGYVPSRQKQAKLDDRYARHRHTDADTFSSLEAMTFWGDLRAAGRRASEVVLLGFNGGAISASEFRIAAALGARVGVVADSGRAADEFLADEQWHALRTVGRPDSPSCVVALRPDCSDVADFLLGKSEGEA